MANYLTIESARKLVNSHSPDAGCASTSLAAILPFPIAPETARAAFSLNTVPGKLMLAMTYLARIELSGAGFYDEAVFLGPDERPSHFFRAHFRQNNHLAGESPLGGFMVTDDLAPSRFSNVFDSHVIAVCAHHGQRQKAAEFTVWDTFPTPSRPANRFTQRVSADWLDRRITVSPYFQDAFRAAAISVCSIHDLCDHPRYPYLLSKINQVHKIFLPFRESLLQIKADRVRESAFEIANPQIPLGLTKRAYRNQRGLKSTSDLTSQV